MDKLDYKAEVLKVRPDAIFWRLSPNALMGAIFENMKGRLKITDYTTEVAAWKSAYEKLQSQKKVSDGNK